MHRIILQTAMLWVAAIHLSAVSKLEAAGAETSPSTRRQATRAPGRIALQPQLGAMQVTARVPGLDNQAFALGMPETIGCREAMLVNFPEARIEWQGPDADGIVSCSWGPGGRISYSLRLIPAADYVDVEMTVRNHTQFLWHDVFAFNCLNPIQAPAFQDWKLERTYMSKQGKPFCMARTTRVKGHMPTVGFYLPERIQAGEESVFVRGFAATSPDRTDGSWIVTLSEPAGAYLAATAMEAAFLFDNLDRCCLHAAPSFGDIGQGESSTTVSRLYLARGTLDDFLKRLEADQPGLAARQRWARPAGSAADSRGSSGGASAAGRRAADETKPHGRMEEMSPDELEKVLKQAPIAFVPLGTFEHHGWHLPVCFDGIKAHALCERVAQRTGGTVLPTFFYGTGGGHVGYKWTLMLPEPQIAPLIEATLDHLARQGFKVVVLLTGHYPQEQVDMVHRLAREAQGRYPRVRFIGLTEPEITSPQPGDAYGGDHAAKYETSIALALNPGWVRLDRLTAGREPAQTTLPATPRKNVPTHDPTHPLYAIYGQDPRTAASKELGEKLVAEIVSRLARQVEEALKSEVERNPLTSAATAQSGSEQRAELAKWDDAATHRSQTGPGGTEWDAQYRSFIQTDENATSKGFPTHAEAAKQILADAAKSPDNLRRHQGWVLFIKHFSQAYRPDSATVDLKRLYEDLVTMQFGGTARKETLLFDGDARLTIRRDVVYGKAAPEIQRLDAYLVKSDRPTPVLLEFHGGGWRRGAKSQFLYAGGLMETIMAAGISVISVDYRLTPKHAFPAQVEDAGRAVQFVRSKAKEWNLDPERIVAMGGSAGAHLSAWVALHDDLAKPDSPDPVERHSTRLRAFVDLWGPMDLTRVRPTELAQAGLRGADFADAFTAAFACTAEAFEQDPEVRQRVREASPLFLVTRDDPPALIVHAAGEDMAPGKHPPVPEIVNDPHSAWHGALLADAMRAVGIEVVCRIGPQVGKDQAADNAAILDFLRRHLSNKENRP